MNRYPYQNVREAVRQKMVPVLAQDRDLRMKLSRNRAPSLFMKLFAKCELEALVTDKNRLRDLNRWRAIASSLATVLDVYNEKVPLGTALAQLGYAEISFERLIMAREDNLLDLLGIVGRRLRAASQPVDWSQVAPLVFRHNDIKNIIAFDYFRTLEKKAAQ